MKAIILAAGEGTRLRPHTADRPKCLVSLAGRPLLAWQLDVLRAGGVNDIVLVTGYRAERLDLYGSRRVHNPAYATSNMVHSLMCAAGEFTGLLLVSYADIIYSPAVLARLQNSDAACAVTVDRAWLELWSLRSDDPLADAESLRIAPDGRIEEIGQTAASVDDIPAQYMGLMQFTTAGLEALQRVHAAAVSAEARQQTLLRSSRPMRNAHMTDLLQAMIDEGCDVEAVEVTGDWLEVDTCEDLRRYEAALDQADPPRHLQFLRALLDMHPIRGGRP